MTLKQHNAGVHCNKNAINGIKLCLSFSPVMALNIRLCTFKNAPASGGLRPTDPLPGLRPSTPLGDFCPQTPWFGLVDPPLWEYIVLYTVLHMIFKNTLPNKFKQPETEKQLTFLIHMTDFAKYFLEFCRSKSYLKNTFQLIKILMTLINNNVSLQCSGQAWQVSAKHGLNWLKPV